MSPIEQAPPPLRRRRRWPWVLVGLVALLVLLRVVASFALLPLVRHALAGVPGYDITIEDVDVSFIRGAYRIDGLNVKMSQPPRQELLSAERIDFSVEWKQLIHGAIVGEIEVDRPTFQLILEEKGVRGESVAWQAQVRELFPLKINRVKVNDGKLRVVMAGSTPPTRVVLTNVDVAVENLTNSLSLSKSLVAEGHVSFEVFGSGRGDIRLKVDPYAAAPTFDVDAVVKALPLSAISQLTDEQAKLRFEKGTLAVFAEARAKNGVYEGYVKPLVFDVEVEESGNPAKRVWESFVESVAHVLENRQKQQVASKIRFHGTMGGAQVDILTSIVTLLRNAFVRALEPVLDGSIDLSTPASSSSEPKP